MRASTAGCSMWRSIRTLLRTVSYISPSLSGGEGITSGVAVARGRLEEGNPPRFAAVEVIFRAEPKVDSTLQYGSRLAFDGAGHVFVSLGDRAQKPFRRPRAG